MKLGRFVRTVAPLRPIQIYGRLIFRLRRPRPNPAAPPERRSLSGWVPSIVHPDCLSGPGRVTLLNRQGEIDRAEQWNDPGQDKLWLYNLHYFDALAAPADNERQQWRRDLVCRWIEENPPGEGNGWEPYPASLRIVNWIKWALNGAPLESAWLHSLAVQARWLEQRLEWHLLGNHLFANAKALVFAGLFFEGPEAERWLARGLNILDAEIAEQILADGGHFELSPMYHSILLEDLLDMLNLAAAAGAAGRAPFPAWRDVARKMGHWLAAMTHPDGRIAFFNDAAFGVAAEPAALAAYAERLGIARSEPPGEGITHLASSGYVRLARGRAVALLDVGRIGPDYLPGHAHADTLSFELSVDGARIIVNGGTSTYAGARRARERGTSSHATVTVAGTDSSELWSAFRAGRRARIVELTVAEDGDALCVSAGHDGYRFLAGRPRHRRAWRLTRDGLSVVDEIVGGSHRAIARFPLHPDVAAEIDSDGRGAALGGGLRWDSSAPLAAEPFEWSPEFGLSVPTLALSAPAAPAALTTRLSW